MPAFHPPSDQVAQLVARLRGQVLLIPDLETLFRGWPTDVNQNLDRLRLEVDKALESFIADETKLRSLQDCDFALLCSLMFPRAEWAELRVAAGFVAWIFIWDDEIDEDGTEVATHQEHALSFCKNSVDYVRRSLLLDSKGDYEAHDGSVDEDFGYPLMALFGGFARHFRTGTDRVQRKRTFDEIVLYMNSTLVEQSTRHCGQVPTPRQYFNMRLGTSGIKPALSIIDHIANVRLPEWIMKSDDMKIIWEEATTLCMLINDIFSLKKELNSGSVLNIVPILFNARMARDLDTTMQDIESIIRNSAESLERAIARLKVVASEVHLDAETEVYTGVYYTLVTGILRWALTTKRYNMTSNSLKDGSIVVYL